MLVFLSSDVQFCTVSVENIFVALRQVISCCGAAARSRNPGQSHCARLHSAGEMR